MSSPTVAHRGGQRSRQKTRRSLSPLVHYAIDAITNGVRVPTWTSPAFQVLFDHYISHWSEDGFNLRYALSIPPAGNLRTRTAAPRPNSSISSTARPRAVSTCMT